MKFNEMTSRQVAIELQDSFMIAGTIVFPAPGSTG